MNTRQPYAADPHPSARIIFGVARVLAEHYPNAWPLLLSEHVADRTGHCPACHSHSHGSPVWPCTLRVVAEQAQHLSQATGHTTPRSRRRPAMNRWNRR